MLLRWRQYAHILTISDVHYIFTWFLLNTISMNRLQTSFQHCQSYAINLQHSFVIIQKYMFTNTQSVFPFYDTLC